jgi:hypothetical protein
MACRLILDEMNLFGVHLPHALLAFFSLTRALEAFVRFLAEHLFFLAKIKLWNT